tara:strand:- start:787 stop:1401 length:615 start_codon:yes stop_codon:yes gene_type:complete
MTTIVHSKNLVYLNNVKIPNSPQDLLMISLTKFFSNTDNLKILLSIVKGTSKISLRIIDWFVTNYSKKMNTSYPIYEKNNTSRPSQQFIVYLNYKQQLKAYSKKQFDPFCRRERIAFYYTQNNSNECIYTTVGQLNFFRWAIRYKILDYIMNNLKYIECDMNKIQKDVYNKEKYNGKRKKRTELSKSATKTLNKHNIKITLDFT